MRACRDQGYNTILATIVRLSGAVFATFAKANTIYKANLLGDPNWLDQDTGRILCKS